MARVDVLIVGGGIAGASAGYFLAEHAKVLLVERESGYGYHASGRSAAEWTAAHFDGLMRSIVLYGRAFFDAPPAGFASVPLMRRRGNLMVARPEAIAAAEAMYAHAAPANPGLVEISPREALAIVPFLREELLARVYWEPENAEIDVDALHQGFLRGLRARGGETRADTEFLGAERISGGWRVRLGSETVECGVILNAAGAWADRVAEASGVTPLGLEPRRRTAFTFDPGFDAAAVPPVDEVGSGFYFKASGPVLMVSPGDQTPSAPCDAQPDEYDLAVGVDLFETMTTLTVPRMKSRWAGLRTFTADEMPVAGFATDAADFFWLVGQGGGGIMSSPALGDLAARLVRGASLPTAAQELGLDERVLSPARLMR